MENSMFRTSLTALALSAALAGPAFALECSPSDEQSAGKAAAASAVEAVKAVVPVEGRQMLNITSCDARAGTVRLEFRYNYMSGGAYYWLEGRAEVKGDVATLTPKRLSENLMTANRDKGGTLLASR
jgi:hypothetical protein